MSESISFFRLVLIWVVLHFTTLTTPLVNHQGVCQFTSQMYTLFLRWGSINSWGSKSFITLVFEFVYKHIVTSIFVTNTIGLFEPQVVIYLSTCFTTGHISMLPYKSEFFLTSDYVRCCTYLGLLWSDFFIWSMFFCL